MSKTQEALKLALEALEYISSHYMSLPKIGCMALAAVEEAIAEQPAPVAEPHKQQSAERGEPAAWMIWTHGPVLVFMSKDEANMEFDRLNHAYPEPTRMLVPLYTSQPASKPLTDAQIDLMTSHIYHRGRPVDRDYRICLFRQAEAAHGIYAPSELKENE